MHTEDGQPVVGPEAAVELIKIAKAAQLAYPHDPLGGSRAIGEAIGAALACGEAWAVEVVAVMRANGVPIPDPMPE